MNIIDKVLVFTPTYQINGKDQISDETLESIKAMGGKVEFDFVIGRYNPYPARNHHNILVQYKTARQIFLDSDYSHLITIEHDMIVPSDALETLWKLDVPVAYGLYVFRHNSGNINAYRYENNSKVGSSLSLYPVDLEAAKKKIINKVSGAGFGCLLIERRVLEQIEFHGKAGVVSDIPDVEFATDCLRAGFEQINHFGVKCGHIEPSGKVLYPFQDEGRFL
jgi:hypothetical protein